MAVAIDRKMCRQRDHAAPSAALSDAHMPGHRNLFSNWTRCDLLSRSDAGAQPVGESDEHNSAESVELISSANTGRRVHPAALVPFFTINWAERRTA